ncbi:hypothetical protein GXP67_11200 [Rhodocytophaga rosea]|uniref:Lipoprotein n=1 Tax=Rhodocytophaga rosea TaxID=2704465 RepID=A0A6C0GHI9_9BACT|nr:hypothetical protein [Rhodocytophaga rosea]QHT67170.1 hypothetical protein GXP67_11200 [Rhodocytophaga rosea]
MKKIIAYFILILFLATSCYRPGTQPWQPKQHGPIKSSKKPRAYKS